MRIAGSAILLAFSICAFAQTAPQAFEVASVKPAPPPSDPQHISSNMSGVPGGIRYTNVTLQDIVCAAYGVKPNQIAAPEWLDSERYDIVAKYSAGADKKQVPAMLQSLLAERFKLAMHWETKTLPVYALIAAKGGLKLHESQSEERGLNSKSGSKGHHLSGNAPLEDLANALSYTVDRPVLDTTGIAGKFVIELDWASEGTLGANGGPDGATIFTALQETLGLKLEARKLPVKILTIDHAERVPIEN